MKKLVFILATFIISIIGSTYIIVNRMAVLSDAIIVEDGKIEFCMPICVDSVASSISFGCCVKMDTLILNGDTLTDFSNIQ